LKFLLRKKLQLRHGFRLIPKYEQQMQELCGASNLGAITCDILNLSTREWSSNVKAIWTSNKFRITDPNYINGTEFLDYNDKGFLIEIVHVRERQRGEVF